MFTNLSQCPVNLNALNVRSYSTLSHLMGIKFTAIGPDFIMGEMPVDERTRQPYGVLHGGASIVLAETLGSIASGLLANLDEDVRILGIEVSGSHVRAVSGGIVTGICKALKLGRTMHFWQIDVRNQDWQLCCAARLTVNVSRRPAGVG